jgi:hypothetical protein
MDVYRNSLRTVHIGRVSSFWNQSMWPMETDSHGSSSSPSCGVERSNWAGGWVDKPGLKNMQSQVGIIIHLLGMEQRWNKVKCILWYLMISYDYVFEAINQSNKNLRLSESNIWHLAFPEGVLWRLIGVLAISSNLSREEGIIKAAVGFVWK